MKTNAEQLEMRCRSCDRPTYGINFVRVKRRVYCDNGHCPPEEKVKSKKLSDDKYDEAFRMAFACASAACSLYLVQHPGAWFPCGFAWVEFDGRDPAVAYLKKTYREGDGRRGNKGYPKGWHIWDPSRSNTQCMEAKSYGAREFARVLASFGITCVPDSRMD